jgi:hypothetical protein
LAVLQQGAEQGFIYYCWLYFNRVLNKVLFMFKRQIRTKE